MLKAKHVKLTLRGPTLLNALSSTALSLSLLACEPSATRSALAGSMAGQASAGHHSAGARAEAEVSGDEAGSGLVIHAGAEAGAEAGARAGAEAAEPWSNRAIYEGLKPSCAPCHSAGQTLPYFESLGQFERLIVMDPAWVRAGSPDESELIKLLSGSSLGRYTQMPPSASYRDQLSSLTEQRPAAPSIEALEAWIAEMDPTEPFNPTEEEQRCASLPARRPLARLSRVEYQRAIEALLGTRIDVASDLPADHEAHGFTHLAELLTLSPLLLEKYELAAQSLAAEAVPERHPSPQELFLEGERDMSSEVGAANDRYWNLWANGELSATIELPASGLYEITISVGGGQAGPEPVRFALTIDGIVVEEAESAAMTPAFEQISFQVPLVEGAQRLGVRFLNDYWCPEERYLEGLCAGIGDRNLHVDSVLVSGPLYAELPPSAFEQRYLSCELESLRAGALDEQALERCALDSLRPFLRLAWRAALSEEELEPLWSLVRTELSREGSSPSASFARALRQGVHAALLSPRFLLREEPSGAGEALSGFERAMRLAALIWQSHPDEQLLEEASSGELNSEEGLSVAVRRMLADPRAESLATEFAARWLTLPHLDGAAPDYEAFPSFDEELRREMRRETEGLLLSIFREERPLLELIDAEFTWLTPRLAEHYGLTAQLDPALGETPQRVTLPQGGRLGALTHASWLTLSSQPTRTSPVVRGKWVLENLLCLPPPPPPPGVEGLPPSVDQDASVRARLEQHRADPACAACHTHMDAIGFGFEQLDGTGAFRLSDSGRVIETAGALPPLSDAAPGAEGAPFEDAVSLARALRADPRVERCVAERFVIYALGRGLRPDERCLVDEALERAAARGMSLQALVESVALSPLFLTRGEERP